MSDDYKNVPQSLAQKRAEKAEDARLWPVRDMLVAALRDIDNGAEYTSGVLCLREKGDPKVGSGYRTTYWQAGEGGLHMSLGILARVQQLIGSDA